MIRLANSWYRSVFSGRMMLSQSIGCSLVNPSLQEITRWSGVIGKYPKESLRYPSSNETGLFVTTGEKYGSTRWKWKTLRRFFFSRARDYVETPVFRLHFPRGTTTARLNWRTKLTLKVAPPLTSASRKTLTLLLVAVASLPSSPFERASL